MIRELLCAIVLCSTLSAEAKRKIYGGSRATEREFPYHAGVGIRISSYDVEMFCGGSIVHPWFVLTAAHCLEQDLQMVIMVGSNYLDTSVGYWYDIDRIIVPDDWIKGSYNHDITLLQTKVQINFIPGVVSMVQIPDINDRSVRLNSKFWITGWGLRENQQASEVLYKIEMTAVTEQTCSKYWLKEETARLCVVSNRPRWGTCHGDSGGGLIRNNIIYGTLSYGTYNCSLNKPEVYMYIPHYSEWIQEQISTYRTTHYKSSMHGTHHND